MVGSRIVRTACLAVLLAAAGPLAAPARQPGAGLGRIRWALLIGVDDYLWLRKLNFCGADMQALAEQLVVSGVPKDHVYLLHDKADNRYRPTRSVIEAQLELLFKLVEPGDLVVVAFSGHGVHLKGKSYLCPTDAKFDDRASLVSVERVYEQLAGCPAALKLFLVDACRNDPRPEGQRAADSSAEFQQLARDFGQSIERPPEGILLLTSCAPGEVAREDRQFGHGVFMHFLLEGLRGQADANRNGRVSLMELYLYANDKTKTYVAHKYFDSQRPALKGELHDDFDLALVSSASLPSPAATPQPDRPPVATTKATIKAAMTNSIGMKMVLVPAGEFMMGSGESPVELAALYNRVCGLDLKPDAFKDEYPSHRVRIARPFYLGTYEVTVGQFRRFVAETGYKTDAERGTESRGGSGVNAQTGKIDRSADFTWRATGFLQTDDHPVVNVSWNDAVAFCQWLTRKEGKTHRLPTEAEWEYACRAGTRTRYAGGDEPEGLAQVGNVADASAKIRFPDWATIAASDSYVFTAPVGRFRPNPFGLYDMQGNVWEWCADWYGAEYYAASAAGDPKGPDAGEYRVIRGGSWNSGPHNVRSANRGMNRPPSRSAYLGFRVARDN